MTGTIPFFTKDLFRDAVKLAYDAGFNQTMDERALDGLDDDTLYPVTFFFDHHHARHEPRVPAMQARHAGHHIRCVVAMDERGTICLQDVTPEFFAALPRWDRATGEVTLKAGAMAGAMAGA